MLLSLGYNPCFKNQMFRIEDQPHSGAKKVGEWWGYLEALLAQKTLINELEEIIIYFITTWIILWDSSAISETAECRET